MSRTVLRLALLLALVLAAGCGQVPSAVPGQTLSTTPGTYPPPPTVPTIPPTIPTPTPTRLPPRPTATPPPTPIQPTPFAPKEPLPASFPTVVYAVQPPGQAVQLWRLHYEGGMLREELWLDLAPAAAETQDDPRGRGVGYMWVDRLIPSADSRYVALILRAREGSAAYTLVIGEDGKISAPTIVPTNRGVGLLAWIPGSDRLFVGDSDGTVWGTIRVDGSDFAQFPGHYIDAVLDAVASPDGRAVIFSKIPTDGILLGVVEPSSGRLTPFALPQSLLSALNETGGYVQGYIRNLALSPDGRTCVFTAEHSVTDQGGGQIWLMGTDGSGFRPLGPDNTYDYELAWSPDSKEIAFSRWDPYPDVQIPPAEPALLVGSLWLIDVDSGKERMLLSSEGQYAHWSSHWLPDGSGLLFLSDRGGETDLWFIRPDGSGLQQLTWPGGLVGEIALLGK